MRVPSMVAAFARIVRFRVDQLGAFRDREGSSPVLDALFAKKEPKTGTRWHDVLDRRRLQRDVQRRFCADAKGIGSAHGTTASLFHVDGG